MFTIIRSGLQVQQLAASEIFILLWGEFFRIYAVH